MSEQAEIRTVYAEDDTCKENVALISWSIDTINGELVVVARDAKAEYRLPSKVMMGRVSKESFPILTQPMQDATEGQIFYAVFGFRQQYLKEEEAGIGLIIWQVRSIFRASVSCGDTQLYYTLTDGAHEFIEAINSHQGATKQNKT